MLLPDTDASGAASVAELVRATIQATGFEHEGNLPFCAVTGSSGVATLFPSHDVQSRQPDMLIAAADTALYRAKNTGRNRVVTASQILTSATPPVVADDIT